jgi:hypothetical protein
MRIVRKDDIAKSERFALELKRLLKEGREERDKKIFEIEEELGEFLEPWNKAFFQGRTEELSRIQEKINTKKNQKLLISSQWSITVNKVSSDLMGLNAVYAPEMLNEIDLGLKRVEKFFDFSHEGRIYSGATDSFVYHFQTNLDLINETEERLVRAKSKITEGRATLSLKSLLAIFDSVMSSVPDDFPLSQTIIGDGMLLSSFRERRELAAEPTIGESPRRYLSVNSPNPLGDWGKKQPLKDYWKKS